jgi:hypothetical protein
LSGYLPKDPSRQEPTGQEQGTRTEREALIFRKIAWGE